MSEAAEGGGGGFWGIWDRVKETSTQVLNVYKEDLQEFTSSLTTDTKQVIVQSAEIVKKATEDISTDEVSEGGGEDSTDRGGANGPSDLPGLSVLTIKLKQGLDSFLSEYPAQQTNDIPTEELVFLQDPEDLEGYEEWLKDFDLQQRTDEVSHLLTSDDLIRQAHAQYVPAKVGYGVFWKRYFFQQHKLQETENRRALLLEKATAAIEEEEDLGWGDDDDSEGEEEVIDDAAHPPQEGQQEVPTVADTSDSVDSTLPVTSSNFSPEEVGVEEEERPLAPVSNSPSPIVEVIPRKAQSPLRSPSSVAATASLVEPSAVEAQTASTVTADLLDLSGPATPSSPAPQPSAGILSPQPSPGVAPGMLTPVRVPSPLEKSPTVLFDDLSGSGGSSSSLLGEDWEVVPEKATPPAVEDDLDDAWADWE